jgi:hypothetical protein
MSPGFEQLQTASAAGDLEAARALLEAGVDPNADYGAPHGWSPLMEAGGKKADIARINTCPKIPLCYDGCRFALCPPGI